MMRSVTAVAAAVLVSLVAGGCGSSPGGTHARVTQCPARALVLRPGTPVVPMTGEHAVMYALANRGPVPCTVHGYPQVVPLRGRPAAARFPGAPPGRPRFLPGRHTAPPLPFHYATGGGAYIPSSKPATVVLAH